VCVRKVIQLKVTKRLDWHAAGGFGRQRHYSGQEFKHQFQLRSEFSTGENPRKKNKTQFYLRLHPNSGSLAVEI
jgi:hypothetical protein